MPGRYGQDELLEVDAEGRCVITDHGHFVLFNVYAPALSSADRMEERFAFKLKLFEVSSCSARSGNRGVLADANVTCGSTSHALHAQHGMAWLTRNVTAQHVKSLWHISSRLSYL